MLALMPTVPLSNGNVTLRQWREADASFYVRAILDPEIQRWTTERPDLTEDAAREAILRHLVHTANISLAITDGRPVDWPATSRWSAPTGQAGLPR